MFEFLYLTIEDLKRLGRGSSSAIDSTLATVLRIVTLSVRMMLKQVAVIGSGAAGLCVGRYILSRLNVFASPVVFEMTDKVGGTWCYDERVGTYENGWPVQSSMYRDLR